MNYQKETTESLQSYIDCYWESHDMKGKEIYVYPSLPEPYINFYFPVQVNEKAWIKGISSKSDFFEMRSKLFGVRCYLKGYIQLKIAPVSIIINQFSNIENVGGEQELHLESDLSEATSFQERIGLFQNYFENKMVSNISQKEENISNAFQYLITEYRDPKVIQHYSEKSGFSTRTVNRWFTNYLGVSPKRLSRIARFHKALSGLYSHEGFGYYFDCGYYDQAHFIKEFKEFTGITPEEYFKIVSDLYNS